MKDNYEVGYGNPPKATRFGNRPQPNRSSSRGRPQNRAIDVAAAINRPIKVRQRGTEVSMHAHEAAMHGLSKTGLSGKIGAIKQFLLECKKAGLLAAAPIQAVAGVVTVPEGVPIGLAARLVRIAGPPPWDADLLEDYKAEYERDCENIERLAEREKVRQK